MTHVIGIINQKGGVGKTTTAVNIAACLGAGGRKTLLVDMDPQGNATSAFGVDRASLGLTSYELLIDSAEPQEAIIPTSAKSVSLIPSTVNLVGAELELIDLPDRSNRLALALSRVLPDFDYVIVDAPPSLGLLTVNILVFVKSVLIPVQAEYFALEGLSMLKQTVDRMQKTLNPDLSILGLALTMYDGRTNLAREVAAEVRRVFGGRVFRTTVHRTVRISESASHGLPMIYYDLGSRGAQDYISLTQEVVHVCEETGPRQGARDAHAIDC